MTSFSGAGSVVPTVVVGFVVPTVVVGFVVPRVVGGFVGGTVVAGSIPTVLFWNYLIMELVGKNFNEI